MSEILTCPSLVLSQMPDTPHTPRAADIFPHNWGSPHRLGLCTVAHIYMSHTDRPLCRYTASGCLPCRKQFPWSSCSLHRSSRHHKCSVHTCTSRGRHIFWPIKHCSLLNTKSVVKLNIKRSIYHVFIPVVVVQTVKVAALAELSAVSIFRVFSVLALTLVHYALPPTTAHRGMRA